jgi:hypothetical protein
MYVSLVERLLLADIGRRGPINGMYHLGHPSIGGIREFETTARPKTNSQTSFSHRRRVEP